MKQTKVETVEWDFVNCEGDTIREKYKILIQKVTLATGMSDLKFALCGSEVASIFQTCPEWEFESTLMTMKMGDLEYIGKMKDRRLKFYLSDSVAKDKLFLFGRKETVIVNIGKYVECFSVK